EMCLITDTQEVEFSRVPAIQVAPTERAEQLRIPDIRHVIHSRQRLKALDIPDVQDVVGAVQFGTWNVVGRRYVHWKVGDLYVPIASLTTNISDALTLLHLDSYELTAHGAKLRIADEDVLAWQIVSDDVAEEAGHEYREDSVDESKKLTVLLAGHDFKFFSEIHDAIQLAGHEVIVEYWENHNSHDEERSFEKLAQADVIFCEWSLGNVSWYSHNKRAGQRLITRFHAQELRTRYLR